MAQDRDDIRPQKSGSKKPHEAGREEEDDRDNAAGPPAGENAHRDSGLPHDEQREDASRRSAVGKGPPAARIPAGKVLGRPKSVR